MTEKTRKFFSPGVSSRAVKTEGCQLTLASRELSLPYQLKKYVVNFCTEHVVTETQPCVPRGTQGYDLLCGSSCVNVWSEPQGPWHLVKGQMTCTCPYPAVLGFVLSWLSVKQPRSLFWRKETWQSESWCSLCPLYIWSWIPSAHGRGGGKRRKASVYRDQMVAPQKEPCHGMQALGGGWEMTD